MIRILTVLFTLILCFAPARHVITSPAEPDRAAGRPPEAAVLTFSSFAGGGYEYTVEIDDPTVLACSAARDYGNEDRSLSSGSTYTEAYTFTGLRPGTTTVTVYGRSPIMENEDTVYCATVDEKLNVTLRGIRAISTFYLYRGGEINYGSYYITRWKDGYHVSVSDGPERFIDPAAVDALMALVDSCGLDEWDGFSGYQPFVLDGESSWLEIRLTDGTSILANGDNKFPENYFEVISRMQDILFQAEISDETFDPSF